MDVSQPNKPMLLMKVFPQFSCHNFCFLFYSVRVWALTITYLISSTIVVTVKMFSKWKPINIFWGCLRWPTFDNIFAYKLGKYTAHANALSNHQQKHSPLTICLSTWISRGASDKIYSLFIIMRTVTFFLHSSQCFCLVSSSWSNRVENLVFPNLAQINYTKRVCERLMLDFRSVERIW